MNVVGVWTRDACDSLHISACIFNNADTYFLFYDPKLTAYTRRFAGFVNLSPYPRGLVSYTRFVA